MSSIQWIEMVMIRTNRPEDGLSEFDTLFHRFVDDQMQWFWINSSWRTTKKRQHTRWHLLSAYRWRQRPHEHLQVGQIRFTNWRLPKSPRIDAEFSEFQVLFNHWLLWSSRMVPNTRTLFNEMWFVSLLFFLFLLFCLRFGGRPTACFLVMAPMLLLALLAAVANTLAPSTQQGCTVIAIGAGRSHSWDHEN